MKEIKLTKGQKAIVDDVMFPILSTLRWQALHCKKRKTFKASHSEWHDGKAGLNFLHWYVIGKPMRGFCVDHINGNTLDNRRSNLRIVTYRENSQNSKAHRKGKLPGSTYDKCRNQWQSKIYFKGKYIFIGYFFDPKSAHEAYLRKLRELECGGT